MAFSDGWKSLHLDELTPTPGFPGDIYKLQSMTVSEILEKSSHSSHGSNKDTSHLTLLNMWNVYNIL